MLLAQSLPHFKVDVQKLGCDFFTFLGHKIFAPTGIGALYGRSDLLDGISPWQGGGSMIKDVTFTKTIYADLPPKFEAGTGSLADAVGLGAALNYLDELDLQAAGLHETALLEMATDALLNIPGCSIISQAPHKAGVLSFNIDGHSAQEIAEGLNAGGVLQSDRGIIVLNLSCVDLEFKSLRVHLLQFITLLKMLKDL